MIKTYTDIYKGFQIRDCNYLFGTPEDTPIRFDIVKWEEHEPYEVTDLETGEKKQTTRNCYSVATLEYDEKEPCFELISIGLRWLDAHPDKDVEDWIIKWCEYKLHELYTNEIV